MTKLSPAAKAVIEAVTLEKYNLPLERLPDLVVRKWSTAVSVALRAAANQVVPKTPPPKHAPHYEEGIWDGKDDAREQLLAIADELDGPV